MIKILLSCLTHSFEISKLKYNHDCKTVSCPRVKVSRISQWVCFPKLLVLWSPPSMFWSLLCKHLKEMSSKCFCLSEFRFWSPITLFLFFFICLFVSLPIFSISESNYIWNKHYQMHRSLEWIQDYYFCISWGLGWGKWGESWANKQNKTEIKRVLTPSPQKKRSSQLCWGEPLPLPPPPPPPQSVKG